MGLFDWFKSASEGKEIDTSSFAPVKGESASLGGLDFQEAIEAHQKWKARLQACIDGNSKESLDPRVVCRDDQCVLGKWINGPGASSYGSKPVFSQLKIEHAQFHVLASEVLLGTYSGRTEEAMKKLDGVFTQSSLRTKKLLANLFLDIHQQG
jgi:Chemoreceptor zinc-binding domain